MNATKTENEHGQAIGEPINNWRAPPVPPRTAIDGQWCRMETLDAQRHGADLYRAVSHDHSGRNWTYLHYGPFANEGDYLQWLGSVSERADPMFVAFVDKASGAAVGVASYMRIDPAVGCIEVGHVHFSPLMQRTPVATEAMYLMMKQAFALGYRRYEWKCDSCNEPSRRAAKRFGFSYEGIFRQATLYKGRNRDTAWYAMIDKEWPLLDAAYQRWLAPQNFDDAAQQRQSLSALTAQALGTGIGRT